MKKLAKEVDLVEALIHSRQLTTGKFNKCLKALIAKLQDPDNPYTRTNTLRSLAQICPELAYDVKRRVENLEGEERRKALDLPCKLLPILRTFLEAGKVDTPDERGGCKAGMELVKALGNLRQSNPHSNSSTPVPSPAKRKRESLTDNDSTKPAGKKARAKGKGREVPSDSEEEERVTSPAKKLKGKRRKAPSDSEENSDASSEAEPLRNASRPFSFQASPAPLSTVEEGERDKLSSEEEVLSSKIPSPVSKKSTPVSSHGSNLKRKPSLNRVQSLPTKLQSSSRPLNRGRKTSINSAHSLNGAGGSSSRSIPPGQARGPLRTGSTTSSVNRDKSSGALSIPMSVWTGPSPGKQQESLRLPSQEVRLPFDTTLYFDMEVPSTGRTHGNKGKGPQKARIEDLADADAFLKFATARRRGGDWDSIKVSAARKDSGKGDWEVKVSLVGESLAGEGEVEEIAVIVTTSARPSIPVKTDQDTAPKEAELWAKFLIIVALVMPSKSTPEFSDFIRSAYEFADDAEELDTVSTLEEKDRVGIELFHEYRQVHPRVELSRIERRLKDDGENDYPKTCQDLVHVIERATKVEDEVYLGFGPWDGEIDRDFRKCLGHIHAFCAQNPPYYPSSIETVTTLQQLCLDYGGGETAEQYLSQWLSKLEAANEHDLEKCASEGITRSKPMINLPPTKKTTRVVSTLVLPNTPPIIDQKPLISVDICARTVDPRRPRRSVVVESLICIEDDMDLTQQFALPPPQPIEAEGLAPPEDLISDDSLFTRSGPTAIMPGAPLHTYPGNIPESFPPVSSKHLSSLLLNSLASSLQVHPTPSPTPELVSPAHKGPEYLQSYSTLFGPTLLSQGCCTRLPFNLSESSLARLQAQIPQRTDIPKERLPFRLRACFRLPVTESSEIWPSVQLNVNREVLECFPANTVMKSLHVLEIDPKYLKVGDNLAAFIRWRTQVLPAEMTISIEFFHAFSEEWALALVNAEGNEDEREYEIYGERARREPAVPLSLLDKTSGLRIVQPVRGCNCDHLETFDLNTYLTSNKFEGQWLCPICSVYTTPVDLRVSTWTLSTLENYDADVVEALDPQVSEEEEEARSSP